MTSSVFVLQLEDLEMVVADHIHKVKTPSFSAAWEEIGSDNEVEETYALSSMKTIEGLGIFHHHDVTVSKHK